MHENNEENMSKEEKRISEPKNGKYGETLHEK